MYIYTYGKLYPFLRIIYKKGVDKGDEAADNYLPTYLPTYLPRKAWFRRGFLSILFCKKHTERPTCSREQSACERRGFFCVSVGTRSRAGDASTRISRREPDDIYQFFSERNLNYEKENFKYFISGDHDRLAPAGDGTGVGQQSDV